MRLGYARGPRAAVKKCLGSSSAEEKNLDFAFFKSLFFQEFVLSGVCISNVHHGARYYLCICAGSCRKNMPVPQSYP